MSNTLTDTTNTIISNAALEAFNSRLAPIRAFATDASPAAPDKGNKVKVLWTPAQTAATDFSASTGYEMQAADATGLDVEINKHKYVSWALSDTELANSSILSLERFGRQKGFQLAKAVVTDVFSLITYANYGVSALVQASSSFVADSVATLYGAASSADWPDMDRSLVLPGTYIANLLTDSAVQSAANLGDDTVIRDGKLVRLMGFDIIECNVIPANGQSLAGFMSLPDAIIFANRYLAPQDDGKGYAAANPVSHAETGITLGYRAWYDPDLGTAKRVLECNYGYRLGNAAALKRIASAATIYS